MAIDSCEKFQNIFLEIYERIFHLPRFQFNQIILFQRCQTVQQITTPKFRSPISPVWDDETYSLYFGNTRSVGQESSIFRYSLRDGVLYSAYIEGVDSVAFILPINTTCLKCKHLFAVGVGSQVMTIKWNGKSTRAKIVDRLFALDANIPNSRTSLARAGAMGRFYGGTFSYQQCSGPPSLSFYRYDPVQGLTRIFGDLVSTSGIAFDDNNGKLYHLDTCQSLITSFDGSQPGGDLCNLIFLNPFRECGPDTKFHI